MISVSAPGKIHLMGEHAVVYGKPALLAAINKRLTVTIQTAKKTEIVTSETSDYVRYAVQKVREHFGLSDMPHMKLTVTSQIPAGFHLGSSAAVAVATVAAVTYFVKKIWNPTLFNQIAYEVEKKQHGNPSGGDNTIVTMGGLLWFRKELEFLKSMWQLDVGVPSTLDHFFLVNTGKPKETTGEMVTLVKSRYEKNPTYMNRQFLDNEEQVKTIAQALKSQNEQKLVYAIQTGEKTLERMGVVSNKVLPYIRRIERSGGAVKILGGGGKKERVGFLLCYHTNRSQLEKITTPYGYSIEQIELGCEGVRLDRKE